MRIPLLLSTITFVMFLFVGSNKTPISSAERFIAPRPSATSKGATAFSSAYTSLTKCGSGMTKKEERAAEQQGSDIPSRCKGPGGYEIYVYYSACSANFSLDKGEMSIPLTMQAINFKQKAVEWRLANGKPFALIMRVYTFSGNDQCLTEGKVTGEYIFVKGLKGYEHIDESIDVKQTPNPNVKARELADMDYAKK